MNFSDYCKNNHFDESNQQNFGVQFDGNAKTQTQSGRAAGVKTESNKTQIDEQTLRQTLGRYQNMSQAELMTELLAEANKQRQAGNLDDQQLGKLASTIKPMLDPSMQNRLDDILRMIK